MSEQTMAEALHDGLRDILAADERVILLGEDVEAGGVFRITEGLFDEFGPRRVFDTPSPSPASPAPPSARPWPACAPSWRSSSSTSSSRRSIS